MTNQKQLVLRADDVWGIRAVSMTWFTYFINSHEREYWTLHSFLYINS